MPPCYPHGRRSTTPSAHGMWAYSHAAFRVDGARAASASRPSPGTLIVGHAPARDGRAGDLPAALLRHAAAGATGRSACTSPRATTCSCPGSSPASRRTCRSGPGALLYRVGVAPLAAASSTSIPIRSATVARAGEVLAAARGEPLGELLSGERRAAFHERAAACGLAPPERAGDVLRGRVRRPPLASRSPRRTSPRPTTSGRGGPPRRPATSATLVQISPRRRGRWSSSRRDGRRPTARSGPSGRGLGALVRRGQPARGPPARARLRPARARPHAGPPRPRRPGRAAARGRRGRAPRGSCAWRCR